MCCLYITCTPVDLSPFILSANQFSSVSMAFSQIGSCIALFSLTAVIFSVSIFLFSINLLAFYHECRSLDYVSHHLTILLCVVSTVTVQGLLWDLKSPYLKATLGDLRRLKAT